ncbi:MAG: hypothetical protein JWR07_3727 [Nevskia sp.]|nr:hypothetical protein [Nevskia sp.]
MKKLWIASPLAAVLGVAVLLTGCGGPSIPADDGSSSGGSGSSGGSTADLVQGCNWLFEADSRTANFAYPETNAVYWVAALPDTVGTGDKIEIAGTSATARYFSFQIYNENGKAESGVSDAGIFGTDATPANMIASGQPYTVTVIYSATATASGTTLVADPTDVSPRAPAHKFLLYRLYLATSGADSFANLPKLTYVAANGTRTLLSSTQDQASCNTILASIKTTAGGDGADGSSSSSGGLAISPLPAVKPPTMTIYRATIGQFQNLDVHYMREKTNDTLGDLLIIRGKAPTFATGSSSPQVRYWSVCSDEFHAPRKVVDCLADTDAHIGTDGYYNVIIAPNTPPDGYQAEFDYLPFGADAFGEPIYRQLLANPSFKQSIDNNNASLLPSLTMGDYFPGSTYCSSSVFSTNLSAGAAAVFKACKSSEGTGTVPDMGN